MIDELLRRIGADELVGGRRAWNDDKLCPYTHDTLVKFDTMDAGAGAVSKAKFHDFQRKHGELADEDRVTLRAWAQAEFVDPTWRNGRSFLRPDFANAQFFRDAPKIGKLLDVAPAHGCHGALLYRDHYRYDFDLHTCDFLPCYNQLLTVLGVHVKHLDLRYDRLNEYKQVFDVVTITEVLEHVTQPMEDAMCVDLHSITRPGSKVLVTFPVKALNGQYEPLGHVRQPIASDISAKLNGFTTLKHGEFSSGKCDQVYVILERR